ncbi:hypothetical protein MGN70_000847 [Eutypa lata]|nr:hypothetical protein MGN70_000847 [Eutypa lata]
MSTATPAPSRPEIVCPDSGPEPPYPLHMEGEVISGFGRGSKELGIPTANLPVDVAATPWIESVKTGVYFGYASLALPPTHPDYAYHSNNKNTATANSTTSDSNSNSNSKSQPQPEPKPTQQTTASSDPPPASTTTQEQDQHNPGGSNSSSSSSRRKWHVYPMVMSIGYNPFYKNSVRSAEVHILQKFGADFYGAPLRLLILGFIRPELDYAGLEALVADINTDCDVARRSLAREAWTPRRQGELGELGGSGGTLDGSWLMRDE